jgi:DNA-binding transcriptional LysR family regulator
LVPEDLDAHKGLKLGWQPEVGNWTLTGKDGSNFSVPYQPQLCSDDMVTLKFAAANGLGIVGLPLYICREDVRVNRLVRVLPDWTAGDAEISLLMPSRKGVLPVVTVFVNYLRERFPVVVRTD